MRSRFDFDFVSDDRAPDLKLMPQNPSPPVSPAPDPAAHAAHSAGAAPAAANDLGGHDEILGEVEVLQRKGEKQRVQVQSDILDFLI